MSMECINLLLQFWGKTPRPDAPVTQFHPAIFHMLDVACVADALMHHGPQRVRQALLHAWRGANPEALIAWLPFLIALHDLGKLSAPFQGQDKDQRQRLIEAGVRFQSRSAKLHHAAISALWIHYHLAHNEQGIAPDLIWIIRDAIGGHHGRFVDESMEDLRKNLLYLEPPKTCWQDWREQGYHLLRNLLAPNIPLCKIGTPAAPRPATIALTGLLVWSDWIGSNEHDFPATPEMDIRCYLSLCRQRAQNALTTHYLRDSRSQPQYSDFRTLFRAISPRPLQEVVDRLPDDGLRQPVLVIIEAPTGEGKTEAALALARRIAALRGVDEIFFALPTMTTGNQMFTRLERFFRTLYGDSGSVRLSHSQAIVIEDDLRRQVTLSTDRDQSDPEGCSVDAILEWFVGPKKAMLAPFGVGTVDQIELGGLNVRHYPLRLFGLAGKVVIIDEVHAYDAYMSVILEHTLTWLAMLGCSIILMSATLPRQRHNALAHAFLSATAQTTAPTLPAKLPYPVLSLYHSTTHSHHPCNVFRGEQQLNLRRREQSAPEEEARRLLELVRNGGAVARICNRVDDAQAIYRALVQIGATDNTTTLVLLHARFPLRERQRREQRISDLVGKESQRTPEQRIIIVGTQVLEQSLDYDVDVMVSDFAPIDLILQRAGRLHRHSRSRPDHHCEPVLETVIPCGDQKKPDWRRWRAIYEPYILWRSLVALYDDATNNTRIVSLPRDYRTLIEAVYSAAPVNGLYAKEVAEAEQEYRQTINVQTAKARSPLTPDALKPVPIVEHGGRAYIEEETGAEASWQLAKTRLGDRVTLVPVYRVNGELSLDPGGTFRIPQDVPPTLEQMKDVINAAIPVSDRTIIAVYRDKQRERALCWPWSVIPAPLRGLYPLPLDVQTHSITLKGRRLRLDNDLGLVIEKEDAKVSGDWFEEDL